MGMDHSIFEGGGENTKENSSRILNQEKIVQSAIVLELYVALYPFF
jgi:hypothetical protein